MSTDPFIGAKRLVGDRTSWSLQDMQEAFSTMPEGSSIAGYGFSKSGILPYVLRGCLAHYIDWETGQCLFDSEEFRSLLAFLNSFPLEKESVAGEDINLEEDWLLANKRKMLELLCLQGLTDMNTHEGYWGEPVSFVGFPVEDGSVGSYFEIWDTPLTISSTCRDKAAAWEFISRKFKETSVELRSGTLPTAIPVNRELFEESLEIALTSTMDGKYYAGGRDGSLIELRRLTEEDIRQYEEFINSVDKINLCDWAVYDIIEDQCGAYFAGDKTLDETAELIQNRVTLYVNENM